MGTERYHWQYLMSCLNEPVQGNINKFAYVNSASPYQPVYSHSLSNTYIVHTYNKQAFIFVNLFIFNNCVQLNIKVSSLFYLSLLRTSARAFKLEIIVASYTLLNVEK